MATLLSETDIGNPSAAQAMPASAPAATPVSAHDADTDELRRELRQVRSDLAVSAGETRRTVQLTGAVVLVLMALIIVLVMRWRAAPIAAVAEGGALKQIEQLTQAVAALETRLASNAVVPPMPANTAPIATVAVATPVAAKLDCAALPAGTKTSDADFSIHFEAASAKILPESEPTLDGVARMLALVPGRCVFIEGHADASGKADKNLALSRERADAVRDYLVERGKLDARYLVPLGRGAASPPAGVDALDPQNRRVVFKVVTGTP